MSQIISIPTLQQYISIQHHKKVHSMLKDNPTYLHAQPRELNIINNQLDLLEERMKMLKQISPRLINKYGNEAFSFVDRQIDNHIADINNNLVKITYKDVA